MFDVAVVRCCSAGIETLPTLIEQLFITQTWTDSQPEVERAGYGSHPLVFLDKVYLTV